jgi:hypothetical protein
VGEKKKFNFNTQRDMEQTAWSGSKHDVQPGNYMFREDCPRIIQTVGAGMEGKWTGRLVMRPLPVFDESGTPLPTRSEDMGWGPTPWIISLPTAQFVGTVPESKFTAILFDPTLSDDELKEVKNSNPYLIAIKRAMTAYKHGSLPRPEWISWFDKDTNFKDKPMRPMSRQFVMQGLTYEKAGEDGTQRLYSTEGRPAGQRPSDPAQFAVLSQSVGQQLVALSNVKDKDDAPAHDMERSYRAGDIVAVGPKGEANQGRFIYVYDVSKPQQRDALAKDPNFKHLTEAEMSDFVNKGKQSTGKRYSVGVGPNYEISREKKIGARLSDVAATSKLWVPWEDALNVPENHELAYWMALAFADNTAFLNWAWDGHREFFTTDVERVLSAAVSESVAADVGYADDSEVSDAELGDTPPDDDEPQDEEVESEPEEEAEEPAEEEEPEEEGEEGFEEVGDPEDPETIGEEVEEAEGEDAEYGGGDAEEPEDVEEDARPPAKAPPKAAAPKAAPPKQAPPKAKTPPVPPGRTAPPPAKAPPKPASAPPKKTVAPPAAKSPPPKGAAPKGVPPKGAPAKGVPPKKK